MKTLYQPDVLFRGGRLHRGVGLLVGDDGYILERGEPDQTVSLPGRVLLPGLVNAHSHAFQRLLRGRFEYVSSGNPSDDFWSWREGMYRAANQMDPPSVYAVSRQAFMEMALAGITTVGEFHYLHHQPDGRPYADPHELSRQVIAAARDVGLRIVLLRVGYQRSGYKVSTNPLQARFLNPDPQQFLAGTEELRGIVQDDLLVTVGIAPHSVRAVDGKWLREISRQPPMLTHMHVAEQPAEIEACLHEHGRRPVEWLEELGLLHSKFTAVHAIHLSRTEVQALAKHRAQVCACPSTERNLGDGVVPADDLVQHGISLSLGSDSQAHIDLLEEARQLEGHLRLSRLKRAVLDPGDGEVSGVGARLLDMATQGGAKSLALPVGALAPGQPADFFTLDVNHPSLLGVPDEALVAALVFGAEKAAVREVAVQGRWVVQEGRHPKQDEIQTQYTQQLRRLSW